MGGEGRGGMQNIPKIFPKFGQLRPKKLSVRLIFFVFNGQLHNHVLSATTPTATTITTRRTANSIGKQHKAAPLRIPATSRHNILPRRLSPQLLGHHVIEAQVSRWEVLEAVLALVPIAQEQVAPRESGRGAVIVHELLERYHAGKLHLGVRAPDIPVVVRGHHGNLVHEHSLDHVLPAPQAGRDSVREANAATVRQRETHTQKYM